MNKYISCSRVLLCVLFATAAIEATAQPEFTLSQNVYRLPYENGQVFEVRSDVYSHDPRGRYDLKAQGIDDCSSHRIVAAAAGVVEFVVDNNTQSCPDCGADNNYVWIRHANDEWTKYTHFAQNSVDVNEGDTVCAGTFLGYECWVGATSPAQNRHLHFEVRRPMDPDNVIIRPAGGYMDSVNGYHLIPVISSVTSHFMVDGDLLTPSSNGACATANITIPAQIISASGIKIYIASGAVTTSNNSITCANGSNVFLQAVNSVTLSPGFAASSGSYFHAKTGNCSTTPFPGGCN
jgi:Peptidase family M23